MSNASTAIAQAHTTAQDKKAATEQKKIQRERQFQENVTRKNATSVITLEAVKALIPTDAQMAAIARTFAIKEVDFDELFGGGYLGIMTEIELMSPDLVTTVRGEQNFKALEMHIDRIVGARIASAHGQAQFYETKRQYARDLSSGISNQDRDEDRMGVDGQANKAADARQFAASIGMKAYALAALAEGSAKAYAEYFGSEWKPYAKKASRSLSREIASAEADALGI